MTTASQSAEIDEQRAFKELVSQISDRSVHPDSIASLLDQLGADLRPRVVRRLGKSAQRSLYEKVESYAPLSLEDLVPSARAELEEVRHYGRNTLPAFRIFEKRFCRLPGTTPGADDSVAGYNFQAMSGLTGPGYFLARVDPERDEVLVDYARLPEQKPDSWPEIRSNERGLARLVYGFMVDRLRRVSEHVTIGSASKHGKEIGSYFVLSREA